MTFDRWIHLCNHYPSQDVKGFHFVEAIFIDHFAILNKIDVYFWKEEGDNWN